MKNAFLILTLVMIFGCNKNSKEKPNKTNVSIIKNDDRNNLAEEIKKIGEAQEIVDREIHLYSRVQGNKYKYKDTTYSMIATYLGASLNDYFYFPFKGENGTYFDFAYGKNHLGDIPFDHYDAEMKSELIGKKFIIKWTWKTSSYPCCEGQMNNTEDDIASILSVEYHKQDSLNKKLRLIKKVDVNNTNYQLYENLVFFGHDTINASRTTESLSIFKNGTFVKELYKDKLLIDFERFNEISFQTTIASDENKVILMLDIESIPSAPGQQTKSFIQFEEQKVKQSKFYNIDGSFTVKNGEIYGKVWEGFYEYELPYKLTEKLELEIDLSKVYVEKDLHLLKINDSIRYPPIFCEIEMLVNPFGDKPLETNNVILNPNKKVTLIYKELESDWIKIKVSNNEGWIKDYKKMLKIGCQPAG
ncbi:MAG: hypothetical protein ACJ0QH_01595 [Flavobacteriales bacterium]